MPVSLDVAIPIGATGAVGTITGGYISSVTRVNVGMYRIKLQDNYAGYYVGGFQLISPVTGSAIQIQSSGTPLTVGQPYRITTVGNNTDAAWRAVGVPAGVTIAVGVSFVAIATGSGASGTGRVKLVAPGCGVDKIELIGSPSLTLAPAPSVGAGGLVSIQCLQAQQSGTTTQGTALQYALADPADGSTMLIRMLLSNSSVQVGGS